MIGQLRKNSTYEYIDNHNCEELCSQSNQNTNPLNKECSKSEHDERELRGFDVIQYFHNKNSEKYNQRNE